MESNGAVNIEQIRAYTLRFGAKQTEECLRKLGVMQQFYNAYCLPVGKELLAEVNGEMVRLATKILEDPEATEDDKAMYRAYAMIARSWAKKVHMYSETVKSLQDAR